MRMKKVGRVIKLAIKKDKSNEKKIKTLVVRTLKEAIKEKK